MIEQGKMSTMDQRVIDDYRRLFSMDPIGCWVSASGTFSVVMRNTWLFKEDGTGTYFAAGPFGGRRREMHFVWQRVAERTLQLRATSIIDEAGEAEDDIDGDWMTLSYDFCWFHHDGVREVAMYEVGHNPHPGFWGGDPLVSVQEDAD